MAAFVFIIAYISIPIPAAGTCSDPCGKGTFGILLSPVVRVLIASVALFKQALFLGHRGLIMPGANIVSMDLVGSFAGYGTFRIMRAFNVNLGTAAVMTGLMVDWATSLAPLAGPAVGIRGESPYLPRLMKIVIAFIPTEVSLGIIEGVSTAGMIVFLYKRRPNLLIKVPEINLEEVMV